MCNRDRELSFDYRKGPSFSSTLLEHIYKSIDGDDGDRDNGGNMKQQEKEDAAQRANLLDKWLMEKKKKIADVQIHNKIVAEPVIQKKFHYIDNDPLFFSTGSNSSDSNSSLFSDHDPIPVVLPTTKTRSSCFLPPKPIRTREVKNSGGSKTEQDDDVPASTKSRALKLYSHLKKMKQPISPGVKLTTFINSILSKSNIKKQQSNRGSTTTSSAAVRPTCSSASSFTRTCLTTAKTTSSTRTNYASVKPSPVNVKIKTVEPNPQLLSAKLDDRAQEQNTRPRPQVLSRASNSKATSKISVGRVSEDARSDCSDDLFELDHLKISNINVTNGGDLPVFETTRISTTSHRNRVLVFKHSDC